MKTFVNEQSILREVWGKADTVMFIFAGAAAEFSLNKSVDWLYYTGKLPSDPLGRLFSTVTYSRAIIFSEYEEAVKAIERITAIHNGVEQSRGARIPQDAYLDVLFMLIDYSIRSFELLERNLSLKEKEEIYDVFYRMGKLMHLEGLPEGYTEWLKKRVFYVRKNLVYGHFSADLYRQYRKHLGWLRYQVMLEVQRMLVPVEVRDQLKLNNSCWGQPLLQFYKWLKDIKLDKIAKHLLLPSQYKAQIQQLDVS